MQHLVSHQYASWLVFPRRALTEYSLWVRNVRNTFLGVTITPPISQVECCHKHWNKFEFFTMYQKALLATPQSTDLSRPRKTLYQELVEGVELDLLCGQLSLLVTELHSFWFWTPVVDYLSNLEFSLTWWLIQNVLSLNEVAFRVNLADPILV